MKNILSIFSIILFILIGFGSVDTNESTTTTSVSNSKNYNIPSKYINRKIHPYPFWCEEYLIIDENLEFTRVEYESRVYDQRESVTIKGKLNLDGTITFYTPNEWYFSSNSHPTKMLNKWEVDDWGGENNIQFKFYDYGYMNKTSGSGWEEYDVWYRDDECNYPY